MPESIRLYELIKKHKLPIEIISIHDKSAKTIAEVEEKIKPLRDRFWDGKDLPFPIFLDAENKTFEAYGARGWPTTLLINPEGKMVGQFFGADDLERLIPGLPEAAISELLLESTPNWGFEGVDNLEIALKGFAQHLGFSLEIDDRALSKAKANVPFFCSSGSSFVSYLTSMIEPVGLDFEIRGRSIRIVIANGLRSLTPHQEFAHRRIAGLLEKEFDLSFEGDLRNLIAKLSDATLYENVVPDPLSIMQGKLDVKARVSFDGKGKTLRQALSNAVKPLGLFVEIRNEAIYLVSKDVKKP